ncbi:MAG: beta-phosphoglucomutase [Planctomycetota bacterium]|nr:beta-phosphoglucomutase [Planctomycetota bacterium]
MAGPQTQPARDRALRGVIFDLDGVLVTTDEFHFRAWKELADELGLAFDREVNHTLRGVSRQQSLRNIYAHNRRALPPDEAFAAQCDRKNARYVELVGGMTPADVLAGSIRLLEALRAAGIRCAVASASKNTPLVLERTGLRKYFDAVADGNDTTRSKPDPEVFLAAAARLGLTPAQCLGVEDAAVGIEAIHNAGMPAAGIGEQARAAERVFASVGELTLGALNEIFASWAKRS